MIETLMFTIGTFLLGISLIWYSLILRKILKVMEKPPVWILPFIGSIFIISSGVIDAYVQVSIIPRNPVESYIDIYNYIISSPSELVRPYMRELFGWRTVKFLLIFLGSFISSVSGMLYYRWAK